MKRFQFGNRIRAARFGARLFPFGFVMAGVMGLLVLAAIAVTVVLALTIF
jgi:uncharacterized RDD family membrane protein YckC